MPKLEIKRAAPRGGVNAGAAKTNAAKPRWRRRSHARPDEILDAALEEFTESGFAAARVADIARRAKISKAGVYLYFETKEDLLRELIEREVAPLARAVRQLADRGQDDPRTTLGGIIAGMHALLKNPRVFAVPRIVLSVAGQFPEIAAYYRTHVVDNALAAMRGLYEAGARKGVFRKIDPDLAARAVLGPVMVQGFYTHVLGGDFDETDPQTRALAHMDVLMNGLGTEG